MLYARKLFHVQVDNYQLNEYKIVTDKNSHAASSIFPHTGAMQNEGWKRRRHTKFCVFNCLLLLNCYLEWQENTGYGQSAQNEQISRFDNYSLPTWPTSSTDSMSSSVTNQQKHCAGKTGNDGCKYCGMQCLQPCQHVSTTFLNAQLTKNVTDQDNNSSWNSC